MCSLPAPLFSVVIPVYNVESFIARTLRSVYEQIETDFEIVAVNDGSKDGSLRVLQEQADPRLRIIDQANGGECVARNRAVAEARGKYIAFLDSDDVWRPDHLSLAREFFEKNPDIYWFSTAFERAQHIPDSALELGVTGAKKFYAIEWFLEGDSLTSSSSAVVLRSAIGGEDLFPPGIRMFGDNIGWCRFATRYPMMGTIDYKTAIYRQWGGSATDAYLQQNSGAELPVLLMHQQLAADPACTPQARLFYRIFSLTNWWLRVSRASLLPWKAEIAQRRAMTGGFLSAWLSLGVALNHIQLRATRWGVRRVLNHLKRQSAQQAAAARKVLS